MFSTTDHEQQPTPRKWTFCETYTSQKQNFEFMDHPIWLESKYFGQAADAGYQNLLIFTHQKRHNNLPHSQFYVIVPFYSSSLSKEI